MRQGAAVHVLQLAAQRQAVRQPARPDIELVPVWIENLNRVMPKGEFVPIPLLCTVTLGTPIVLGTDEAKTAFLDRSRNALLALATRGGNDR